MHSGWAEPGALVEMADVVSAGGWHCRGAMQAWPTCAKRLGGAVWHHWLKADALVLPAYLAWHVCWRSLQPASGPAGQAGGDQQAACLPGLPAECYRQHRAVPGQAQPGSPCAGCHAPSTSLQIPALPNSPSQAVSLCCCLLHCRHLHRQEVPLHRRRVHPRPHLVRAGPVHKDAQDDNHSPELCALHQEVRAVSTAYCRLVAGLKLASLTRAAGWWRQSCMDASALSNRRS